MQNQIKLLKALPLLVAASFTVYGAHSNVVHAQTKSATPTSSMTPLEEAQAAIDRRDWATAEAILTPIGKAEPQNAFIYYELARLYENTNRVQGAKDIYQAIASIPDSEKSNYVVIFYKDNKQQITFLPTLARERLNAILTAEAMNNKAAPPAQPKIAPPTVVEAPSQPTDVITESVTPVLAATYSAADLSSKNIAIKSLASRAAAARAEAARAAVAEAAAAEAAAARAVAAKAAANKAAEMEAAATEAVAAAEAAATKASIADAAATKAAAAEAAVAKASATARSALAEANTAKAAAAAAANKAASAEAVAFSKMSGDPLSNAMSISGQAPAYPTTSRNLYSSASSYPSKITRSESVFNRSNSQNIQTSVLSSVREWANAWQSQDLEAYFASYVPEFKGNLKSNSEWRKFRTRNIKTKTDININLENLNIVESNSHQVRVTFTQNYQSSTEFNVTRKTLVLVKRDGRWLIAQETSGATK